MSSGSLQWDVLQDSARHSNLLPTLVPRESARKNGCAPNNTFNNLKLGVGIAQLHLSDDSGLVHKKCTKGRKERASFSF